MQYRTIRAASHSGYFRLCPLSEILLGREGGVGGKAGRKEGIWMFSLRTAASATSAALSAASESLASLAGQRASVTLTPKPRPASRAGTAKSRQPGDRRHHKGRFPQSLSPRAPPAAPAPHTASGTVGSGPVTARGWQWHHCQNHPTMGPVNTAPAPAKHIPLCWAHANALGAAAGPTRSQEWLGHRGSHTAVLRTDSADTQHRTSSWCTTPSMAKIHVSRKEWVEAGWQSSQPSCCTMQREPKPVWDRSAPHRLKSTQQPPILQDSRQRAKMDCSNLTDNRGIGKSPGQHWQHGMGP